MCRPREKTSGRCSLVALAVVLAFSAGCGRLPEPGFDAAWRPAPRPVRLAAGDSVEIKFFKAPELNEVQTIRPDGKVSLALVGEVAAAGLTPAELSSRISEAYAGQLIDASAIVIVRSFETRRVLVSGAVNDPGPVAMPGRMTVLEAVLLAGGFDAESAETRGVLLIRRGANGVYRGTRLDLRRAINGAPASAVELEPLDIIYVPRTRIVRMNQWISQHISGLVPRLGLTYTRRISDKESIGVNLDGAR